MRQVKKPEVRKAEIVATAMELFAEEGFERATVGAIIGRMGVAKGCFYHHFSSKAEVFEACVEALAERLLGEYVAILSDETRSPRRRLVDYVDHNYALAARPSGAELAADLHSGGFADVHHRVTESVAARLLPVFSALIAQGVEAGEFDVEDAEFTAAAMLGALTGLHETYAARKDFELARHREHLLALLARMLADPQIRGTEPR